MKKIFSFVMLFAAAATAFVACSKEEVIETPNAPVLSGKTKTITVTSATTRTTIENKQLKWAEGDTYGILFANEDGQIIDYTESPEYSAETETYTLEAPEETAALYCYYPYDAVSNSELENAVSAGATGVKYGIVDLNIYDGEQTGGQYTYMAANAEVSEDNTVNVQFQLLASILELNIYDSSDEPDTSALTSVQVSADKAAGWATLSFAEGNVNLLTEESEELNAYIRANFNAYEGINVYVGTAEEPSKVYVPIFKGEYENLDIIVATENHSFSSNDNRLVINKNEVNITADLYTVKVDLAEGNIPSAGGDEESGLGYEFKNPTVSQEVGDTKAVINEFKSINYGDEGWANNESWYGGEWKYALDVTGNGQMVAVSFDAWPTNSAQAFADELGKQTSGKAEFQGGSLILYSYGKSWVVFYEEEGYPIAYIYVNYHSDGTEEPKEDAAFAISSNGAKITKATGTEDWAVAVSNHLVSGGYGDFLDTYWEIQYTADANDKVTFSAIPENYGYNKKQYTRIYTNNGSNWIYDTELDELWFTFPDGYKAGESNNVNLHGTDSSNTTEYVVVLPDNGYGDATYVIHVVLTDSLDDEGGNGEGEEEEKELFVISSEGSTITQAAGTEDWATSVKDWLASYRTADFIEGYWELNYTAEANDAVTFSSLPNCNYTQGDRLFFTYNGSNWAYNYPKTEEWFTYPNGYKADATEVYLHGEEYTDTTEYVVVLPDPQYGDAAYIIHVVYSGNEGGGNDEPAQPEAFALSSINVIEATVTKAAGDEAWATFAAGRHSNIKEYWELNATGAKDAAYVAFSTCPQWSGTPTIYYASRGSYMANASATTAKNYWTGEWYANNDTIVDLGVAGLTDFGDNSLDYIVILGDYALHVAYTVE